MTENFYTTSGCDGCDKYELEISETNKATESLSFNQDLFVETIKGSANRLVQAKTDLIKNTKANIFGKYVLGPSSVQLDQENKKSS